MRSVLEQDQRAADAVLVEQSISRELILLLRKLRWAGFDDEADRLQSAIGAIPASGRASVLSWPASTD
jgi:hypothetical protein